jgi:hypothetical protein
MQYQTRDSALRALKKMCPLRAYNILGEEMNPAEVWLLKVILHVGTRRSTIKSAGEYEAKKKLKWTNKDERHFRNLKSIARGLALWPIPEWAPAYIKVLERMSGTNQSEKISEETWAKMSAGAKF